MTPRRMQLLASLFERTLEVAPEERAAWLEEACEGDAELRAEVEALLAAHERTGSFLVDTPIADAYAPLRQEAAGALAPGDTLDRYEIVERIGAGGMGEVYRARDTRLGRDVAIKCLPASFSGDPDWLVRFEQEARAAGGINHPNILTIHDIGTHGGHPYLVAELLEGRTLREEVGGGALPVERAVDYAVQAARGLEAAHGRGIVHRDLKPENLFVTSDGRIKVLDFGLAKVVVPLDSNEATARHLTESGVVLGTVSYMSPEQARGERVDHRSDVFSFGLVLYEMLSGRAAFRRGSAVETMHAIIRDETPPLSAPGRELPPALEYVVRRCLEKEPDERFQSMREVAAALAAATDPTGEVTQRNVAPRTGPVEPARPSSVTRAAPASQRAIAAAAAIALVATLTGAAYYFTGVGGRPVDSLAVLPFANAAADADLEYLSEGITESVINSLSRLPRLRVIARSTVYAYKGRDADPRAVGRELGVRAVLAGRVLQKENRLIVRTELVDVADGTQLWNQEYDRDVSDLLAVQREIAREIAERLHVSLSGSEERLLAKDDPVSVEAYQHYLRGRYHWNKSTPSDLRKSREYFQRAIDLDPAYALAYVGLANFYAYSAGLGVTRPEESWPRAEAAATRALDLDPTLGEAHGAVAGLKLYRNRDWPGAEATFKRAIELNPSYPEVRNHYALCLAWAGRTQEALEQSERAQALAPLSARFVYVMGIVLLHEQRYDEAIRRFREAVELDPNSAIARELLGDTYAQKGMREEAVAEWRKAMLLMGDEELASVLDRAYAESGYDGVVRAVWRKRLERLEATAARGEYVPAVRFAQAHSALGDVDRALEWLDKACAERNILLRTVQINLAFDNLRSDPRFAARRPCTELASWAQPGS